ncbi:MAG: RDD family protein [Chloroflexi bacterium]|nr:MAG: RDD family protein [Chloroflexota bacterium]RLC96620.1 MAG: RDD family protein [Chloroflexota bacterium]
MGRGRQLITVEYAGFWVRLVAYLIDLVLVLVIGLTLAALVNVYAGPAGDGTVVPVALSERSANTVTTLLNYGTSFVYLVSFWAWRGQTPGKMLMGLKVVRTDGTRIGWGRSALRYVGYNISVLAFFLGYLWVAVDPEKQGIHDKIADTYVVRLPHKRRITRIYG